MAASYQDLISEIMRDAEKRLGDKFEENVSLERHSLIKEFLDVLVSCGELTEVNRERIEKNPSLKDYFQQPTEMEIETEDKSSQLCDEGEQEDSDEEDQVFEGRTTFPENQ